jgi:hypothetical protein
VNVGVRAAKVAEGSLNSEGVCLQEEPLMSGAPAGGGDGQAHFERHVESWGAAGQLNPTEIVEGISARREQARMRSSRRVGLGISSVARGRSPKAQRPAIKATNSFS